MNSEILTGEKINGWLIVAEVDRMPSGERCYLVRCLNCNETELKKRKSYVYKTKRCKQCFVKDGRTHGLYFKERRTYTAWANILQRCQNPNHPSYPSYGGLGIKVADHWSQFESFFADMGACPIGYQIDRIDTAGNYEPSNCRWIPASDNSKRSKRLHQRRDHRKLSKEEIAEIREKKQQGVSMNQLARDYGTNPAKVYYRTKDIPSLKGCSKKLTPENVEEIRSSHLSGADLARKFSVSNITIYAIRKNRSWKKGESK